MFSKYAREVPDKLTMWELWHMTQANSVAYDFFGWYGHPLSIHSPHLVNCVQKYTIQ